MSEPLHVLVVDDDPRIRTMLRLEHLFGRLHALLPRESAVDHHFALATIFSVGRALS